MKKKGLLILLIGCLCIMIGCLHNNMFGVKINYGISQIYSQEDMDQAIALIKEEFKTWNGCQLHSISYSSDAQCNEDNIAWMNELASANHLSGDYTQCIMFKSDFHTSLYAGEAWEPDSEYTDWQWWLARKDNDQWDLLTWGY